MFWPPFKKDDITKKRMDSIHKRSLKYINRERNRESESERKCVKENAKNSTRSYLALGFQLLKKEEPEVRCVERFSSLLANSALSLQSQQNTGTKCQNDCLSVSLLYKCNIYKGDVCNILWWTQRPDLLSWNTCFAPLIFGNDTIQQHRNS